MVNIEKFISLLKQDYYITVVLFLLELIAIAVAIKHLKAQYIAKLFILFLGLDSLFLFLDLLFLSTPSIPKGFRFRFISITNTIVSTLELVVYFAYFNLILENGKIARVLKLIQQIIVLTALIIISAILIKPINTMEYAADLLNGLELILLIPPCILYFQKLLNTDSDQNLFERPSFWITSSLFFYSASTIPYYLLKEYLNSIKYPFRSEISAAFYYTPIIINIIFLIIAFRWKKPLTT